jgi:hypothetical protein
LRFRCGRPARGVARRADCLPERVDAIGRDEKVSVTTFSVPLL